MRKGFRKAYKDSTLFCIEGGSAGRKTGMLDRDVTFGNKLCMFHSKGNVPDKYIYYVLQAPLFKQTFVNSISGIIGEVSIKKLQGIHIPSPQSKNNNESWINSIGFFRYVKAWRQWYR